MCDQFVSAALATDAPNSRVRCERYHFTFDEVYHIFRVHWTIFCNMLADFYQVVDCLLFSVNGMHAFHFHRLDRRSDLAHGFVMRNRRTAIINRFLYLGFQPLRIGGGFVRVLHRGSAIRALLLGNTAGIVVHCINVKTRNANAFQVVNQCFKLARACSLLYTNWPRTAARAFIQVDLLECALQVGPFQHP